MKKSLLGLILLAGQVMASDALSLRFAYIFELPNTTVYQSDDQTWYVHDNKGLSVADISRIQLLETTDAKQPVKVQITLTPEALSRYQAAIHSDGNFPGLVVLSEGEIVGSVPVIQRNPTPSMVLPVADEATNRAIYQAVQAQR